MNVKQLIEDLQNYPPDAIVETLCEYYGTAEATGIIYNKIDNTVFIKTGELIPTTTKVT